jgi:predicted acyl esterase
MEDIRGSQEPDSRHLLATRCGSSARDALTYPYLAGHGYAGVRVDIRGSGESTGSSMQNKNKTMGSK